MRVLMISLDKTLLGADYSGDALERHQEYAKRLGPPTGGLDIIVFSKKGFNQKNFGSNLKIYPTNSLSNIFYVWDGYKIGKSILCHFEQSEESRPISASTGFFANAQNDILIVTQDPFLTGLTGWLLKRKLKVPLLIHFHGDFWQNKYWLKEKWYNWLLLILSKFLVKRADGVRVVSSAIKEKLTRGGIAGNKIRVIPTPVDLEKFEKYDEIKVKQIREQYKNRKIAIFAGRLAKEKNLSLLIKSIKQIIQTFPNLVLLIIGKGKEKEDLMFQVSSFKLEEKIKLLGLTNQNDLVNYYHAADIYVSSSKHESFGKVLIEAMAAGLPAVATETTGSKEIVVGGVNGFLTPIGDSQALAEKILYLFNNPARAKEMGENGRRIVKEKFDREKIIEQIIKFWKDLAL